MTNPMTTTGDTIYSSSGSTPARLGIGSTGQVLTVASGLPSWATPAGGAGLVLVKTQTIGSAVSSVTVTDAFSTTYDNYRIIISGGAASTACELNMTLGSTTTNYNVTRYSTVNTDTVVGLNNYDSIGSFAGIFNGSTNSFSGIADISCPYLSKYTSIYGVAQRTDSGRRTYASFDHLANTTSYTAFTLTLTDAATATGGTIKVYGYANS
jgi:hypothetical protein